MSEELEAESMFVNKEHVLIVHPEKELVFSGPFYRPSAASFTITNPSKKRVVFALRTTSPGRFLVNPVSDLVEPGASCVVKILMYPNVANKDISGHRFKMLSVVVGNATIRNVDKVWNLTKPESVMVDHWTCRFNDLADLGEYQSNFESSGDPTVSESEEFPNQQEIDLLFEISELKAENRKLQLHSEQLILQRLEKKMVDGKMRQKPKTLVEKVQLSLRDTLVMAGVNADRPVVKNVILNDKVLTICFGASLFIVGLLFGKFLHQDNKEVV